MTKPLKPAPPIEILALIMKRPRNRNEIHELTGYHTKTISEQVRRLHEAGLVYIAEYPRDQRESPVFAMQPALFAMPDAMKRPPAPKPATKPKPAPKPRAVKPKPKPKAKPKVAIKPLPAPRRRKLPPCSIFALAASFAPMP